MMNKRKNTVIKILAFAVASSALLNMTGCFFKQNKIGPAAVEKYAKKYGAEMYKDASDFAYKYKGLFGDYYLICDGICIRVKGDDVKKAVDYAGDLSDYYDKDIKEATVFTIGDSDDDYGYTAHVVAMSAVFEDESQAESYYERIIASYTDRSGPSFMDGFGDLSDFGDLFDMGDFSDLFGMDDFGEYFDMDDLSQYFDMDAFGDLFGMFGVDFDAELFHNNKYVTQEFEEEDLKYTLIVGDDIYDSNSKTTSFDAAGVYINEKTVFFVCGTASEKNLVNEYVDEICEGIGVEAPSSLG